MKTNQKLKIFWVVIILLFASRAYSQNIYITAGAGYGISPVGNSSTSGTNYEANNTTTTIDHWNGTHNYEYIYESSIKNSRIKGAGSFGKGFRFGATVGYMFTENIGAELGFDYLMGNKFTTGTSKYSNTSIYNFIDSIMNDVNTTHTSGSLKSKGSGNMLRFIPALRITAGKGAIKPYLRLGLVVSVANKLKITSEDSETDNSNVTTVSIHEFKYSGGISLGFAGALGANYKISDHMGVFAEFGIITQSWAPKKGLLTKYTIDGVDKLPGMSDENKETEFVNSYSYTSTNDVSSESRKSIKTHYPFSSIGLNVGVSFSF